MSSTYDAVLKAALELSEADRASLADSLLETLGPQVEADLRSLDRRDRAPLA